MFKLLGFSRFWNNALIGINLAILTVDFSGGKLGTLKWVILTAVTMDNVEIHPEKLNRN